MRQIAMRVCQNIRVIGIEITNGDSLGQDFHNWRWGIASKLVFKPANLQSEALPLVRVISQLGDEYISCALAKSAPYRNIIASKLRPR